MDEAEFLALIKDHQKIIHKVCHLYRDTCEDREDLFQEIVFQLWKGRDTFKGMAKISTWMYRIALNTAVATFRKKKPEIEYGVILPDYPEELQSDELAIRQEGLFAVLKQLDDNEKAIIALYFEEHSYKQIAEIIGVNESYIGVRINRIKNKIQKLIIK
ncbi:RNA polymerase sigma factor [Mucilaginibacter sp. HMF5004]|uniref:RNA polymerase sigma factor n=1 Tax=Mucilaginibacter rivuli TaxID=2857527 RepID=UPI001C5D671D|nr:RNA polymerase sigma factor [Mucilaginibacter rivuli]MBW4890438.1 RNA polymerase sigma factor [Mucilaginibacter rivuli]